MTFNSFQVLKMKHNYLLIHKFKLCGNTHLSFSQTRKKMQYWHPRLSNMIIKKFQQQNFTWPVIISRKRSNIHKSPPPS